MAQPLQRPAPTGFRPNDVQLQRRHQRDYRTPASGPGPRLIPLQINGRQPPQPTALVRKADGQMALEVLAADSMFNQNTTKTGCFRRGNPIIDPVSREIMGYQMEIVENPLESPVVS